MGLVYFTFPQGPDGRSISLLLLCVSPASVCLSVGGGGRCSGWEALPHQLRVFTDTVPAATAHQPCKHTGTQAQNRPTIPQYGGEKPRKPYPEGFQGRTRKQHLDSLSCLRAGVERDPGKSPPWSQDTCAPCPRVLGLQRPPRYRLRMPWTGFREDDQDCSHDRIDVGFAQKKRRLVQASRRRHDRCSSREGKTLCRSES